MILMPGLGGIGQQVADNLFELGQSTVKSAVEQITTTPGAVAAQSADSNQADRQAEAERHQRDVQQYQLVKQQMATYIERKQKQDADIAAETTEKEKVKRQQEDSKKQKKESFVQGLLKRVGRGSHGETDKQKE